MSEKKTRHRNQSLPPTERQRKGGGNKGLYYAKSCSVVLTNGKEFSIKNPYITMIKIAGEFIASITGEINIKTEKDLN